MNHLYFWINTKKNDNVSTEINNGFAELNTSDLEANESVFLAVMKEKIEKYSNQLINKEISVTNKGFKQISARLFYDILSIYLSSEMLFDTYFSIVENLSAFYKRTYLETKSPVARLYQGKFSVVYELFNIRKTKTIYEKMMSSNKQIENIIWKAMINGAYNLEDDLNDQTKKDLNWLESNNYISILPINGYVIRLSNNYKFSISLEPNKYRKSYYKFFHYNADDISFSENKSYIYSKKYLIINKMMEENNE